ncbi:hypothetical protein AVEN_226580-1 [Araneus ventricosus]|uniref:Uncharacterized protein n=1 Tax=Araneus ventricosus TaxID=182803 RepID=A0A4Y2JQ63_ARAVE|nr:hypothetical protein AVEN_226580-1 [Araneus ventricosus]
MPTVVAYAKFFLNATDLHNFFIPFGKHSRILSPAKVITAGIMIALPGIDMPRSISTSLSVSSALDLKGASTTRKFDLSPITSETISRIRIQIRFIYQIRNERLSLGFLQESITGRWLLHLGVRPDSRMVD